MGSEMCIRDRSCTIPVFNDELSEQPARVKPYTIEMKENNNWYENTANKAPPRWQMIAKQREVKRFIDMALKAKLIRPSNANAWSQVLLTPKQNGKWRFCLDFRNLNAQSKAGGWPIPNIKHVIERISRTNARYFAVLDLTQGSTEVGLEARQKLVIGTNKSINESNMSTNST